MAVHSEKSLVSFLCALMFKKKLEVHAQGISSW